MISLIKASAKPIYRCLTSKNRRQFYKLLDRYANVKRFRQQTVDFLNYRFIVQDCLSFICQFKEIYVDEIYKFNAGSKSPVIFDCGANIGLSTIYFKEIFPEAKVKAFEADPRTVKVLRHNLLQNGLSDVIIFNKAVWVDNNGVEFGMQGADGGSIYLSTNKMKVDSIRLKDELDKEKTIDMLKIDIEGAEVEVLKDSESCLAKVRHIFVEYHSLKEKSQRLSELLDILTKSGFRYFLQSISNRQSPFISRPTNGHWDLQLNIYGYRDPH